MERWYSGGDHIDDASAAYHAVLRFENSTRAAAAMARVFADIPRCGARIVSTKTLWISERGEEAVVIVRIEEHGRRIVQVIGVARQDNILSQVTVQATSGRDATGESTGFGVPALLDKALGQLG